MKRLLPLALAASALSCAAVHAQAPATPPYAHASANVDSGYLDNASNQARVVFRRTVRYDQTAWLQFRFGEHTNLPAGSVLRMTSVADGGVQRHDGRSVADWGFYSAAFNGDAVVVELVAGANTTGNRVVVASALRGLAVAAPGPETICGSVDNRTQSTDVRQGRLWAGCTGWMIGLDVMLSAGHCVGGGPFILEMNVPLSTSSGTVVRAHPDDQYPFTVLGSLNAGIGSDWSVSRVGPNSNHGQLPTQRNGGQWYQLGTVPPSPASQNIRITGYGVTSPRAQLSQVQKTHVGPLAQVNPTSLCYSTDTSGGNSGSPVIHENTGRAIGIHTHGGCTSTGGCNSGTRVDRSDLQAAIRAADPTSAGYSTYGRGCPSPVTFYEEFDNSNTNDLPGISFLMTPTAGGGWSVSRCQTSCFETGFSSNLNLGDDELAQNLSLGFSFALTGIGGSTTAIDVDSNGWIGLIAGQFTSSDFTESVPELLSEPARLAAFWDDLNPGSGGAVYFDRFPGKAVVTWYQVPEYSNTGTNTFQVQLFANGDIILTYDATSTAADGIAGFSAGNGSPDPGSLDLSGSTPFTTGSGGTPLSLSASAPPVLGTTINMVVSNLPTNTTAAGLVIGFAQRSINLAPLGMEGCTRLTTLDEWLPMSVSPGRATLALAVPNIPSLVSALVYAQGAAFAPGANALGLLASNGGELRLGN